MAHLAAEIIINGIVISAIYALGAVGFTLIFGVSGVLNLAHGAHLVIAAFVAWFTIQSLGFDLWSSSLVGIAAAVASAYILYFAAVRPIERSQRIPDEEKEVFILTATLLTGIIVQGVFGYLFGSSPVTTPVLVTGTVHPLGVNTSINELLIGLIAWIIIGMVWFFINKTRLGKALLAASMTPDALGLIGVELMLVNLVVWGLYGLLTGISGVLLASFLGASPDAVTTMTALAFTIVILGGLGNVLGSLVAAYIIGFIGTLTTYLVSSSITELPALFLLVVVLLLRPQGLFGRR